MLAQTRMLRLTFMFCSKHRCSMGRASKQAFFRARSLFALLSAIVSTLLSPPISPRLSPRFCALFSPLLTLVLFIYLPQLFYPSPTYTAFFASFAALLVAALLSSLLSTYPYILFSHYRPVLLALVPPPCPLNLYSLLYPLHCLLSHVYTSIHTHTHTHAHKNACT
jgi:uncharacterized membrane protein YesL